MRKVMLNTIKIILRSMETELRKQLKSVLNEYWGGLHCIALRTYKRNIIIKYYHTMHNNVDSLLSEPSGIKGVRTRD